jgi:hypothetical protein
MNIAIFETEHFEGAYPVIKLFDNGKNKITIFSYEQSFKQFKFLFKDDIDKYEWVIKKNHESKNHFIYEMLKQVKRRNIEIFYLNTVSNNFHSYTIFIKLLRNVRIIVTIHNINTFFKFKPTFRFRQWIRQSGKRWLIKNVNEFNVVSLTMAESLKEKLPANKKVHCLPGAVFESEKITHPDFSGDSIKIVVPGTIDVRRRNYDQVFELLDKSHILNLPVSVTLLGGYYGEEGKCVLSRCAEYSMHHNNLKFYDGNTVDQPEFDKVMNESHFAWIPSVITTVLHDGIAEEYGKTISSGNLFDIIKHATPFIIPEKLQIDNFLESSAFRYHTIDEIIIHIRHFLDSGSAFGELKKIAVANSENYTTDRVRNRNPDLFI